MGRGAGAGGVGGSLDAARRQTSQVQEFVIGGYTLGGNPFDALTVGVR
jgi:hypothetical protein